MPGKPAKKIWYILIKNPRTAEDMKYEPWYRAGVGGGDYCIIRHICKMGAVPKLFLFKEYGKGERIKKKPKTKKRQVSGMSNQ